VLIMKPILFPASTAYLLLLLMACTQTPQPTTERAAEPASYSTDQKTVIAYETAAAGNVRMQASPSRTFTHHGQPVETQTLVFVNPDQTYQTFVGIGGAITDASAETFDKLPAEKQEELLKAYYDPTQGIGYTIARTHINSCDFSSASYTYVDEGDADLKTFDLAPDKKLRIPMIKRAIAAAGGSLPMYVSPWSPPAWMKTNNNMLQGGKLKPEFNQSWANYYIKFIKGYEAEGIPIWGLTVQNEPMATQTWESCLYTAEEERDFVKNYLGPTLHQAGLGDKKLIVWDHNRDLIIQRAQSMFNDPEARKYVWGMGFHWYEDWTGGTQMFENVRKVNETWPDINLIFTEGCNGPFAMPQVYDWKLGERYGKSMINDFNSGTVAWTDWNILLDETGGPNHVKNFCFAPIHADTRTGELIYTNSYYYIGHFSKFIRPGAKRVQCSSSRSALLSTAFMNPDGSLVVVVMNESNTPHDYFLWINNESVKTTSQPHSISTLLIQ
jgi:glucosylceramidase